MTEYARATRLHSYEESTRTGLSEKSIAQAFLDNLLCVYERFLEVSSVDDQYRALAHTIRDHLLQMNLAPLRQHGHIPCWRILSIALRNLISAPCCLARIKTPSDPVTVRPCSRAISPSHGLVNRHSRNLLRCGKCNDGRLSGRKPLHLKQLHRHGEPRLTLKLCRSLVESVGQGRRILDVY
jgi:hypothetical protein